MKNQGLKMKAAEFCHFNQNYQWPSYSALIFKFLHPIVLAVGYAVYLDLILCYTYRRTLG